MNAFCPNLSNKKVKQEFDELKNLFGEDIAYFLWDKNNGYSLDMAPNGANSILFQSLLNTTKDRNEALRAKAKVYFSGFTDWFGDWMNDPKNSSKVVDENGEPLVVYHGGAKNIEVFANSNELGSRSTTGGGYYTDPKTGEKIQFDSNRTVFFSSNPFVATSYASLYGILYYKQLVHQINDILPNTTGKSGIHFTADAFEKGVQDVYEFLDKASEVNPRFKTFKEYSQKLRSRGEHITNEREILEFRKMLLELRNKVKDCSRNELMNRSEWEFIHDQSAKLINTYNNPAGIERLINGEIPEVLQKEWELFKKIRYHREKEGRDPVANFEKIHLSLGGLHGRYYLVYDGKNLSIWNPEGTDPKVSDMTKEELSRFLTDASSTNQISTHDIENDPLYRAIKNKSQEYAVYLNIRNPLVHDYEGTQQGQGYKYSKTYPFGYVAARQVNKAIKDGNDGVVYENLYDPYLADNYGIFSKNQVKSVFNDGNFSRTNANIYAFIGKNARAKFEQHLHKQRPDMSEEDIRTTLDFLHNLADNKENTAYIKAAIKWVSSNSIALPQDNEKVRQAFDYARARHIDVQKYRTFGEFISSPEMTKEKTKEKPSFNPDEAKAFHNKHTVTTTGGRVFTVYDVEDNEKGQEDVCKAVAAHYPASPWCLSTFTATGKPTNSAKTYWNVYGAVPKKIAYEDGKPVAFSASNTPSSTKLVRFRGIVAEAIDTVVADGSHFITASIPSSNISPETANKLVSEGVLSEMPFDEYVIETPYLKEIEDQIKNTDQESWWDLDDMHPQQSLTDDIVNTFKYDETLHILDEEEAEIDDELAQAFVNEAQVPDPSPLVTPEGRIYGFVDDFGNMFLDEERISIHHPIHEYTHLWDRAIQKNNPKLWKRGVELMKQLPLWNDILNDPSYGRKWLSNGISGEELDNLIASEVHARLVGERGVDIITELAEAEKAKKASSKIVPKIKKWLLNVWKNLVELFGAKTKDDLSKLTIEDFNNMTVEDLVKGYNPNTEETVFTGANPEDLTDTSTLVQHLKNIGINVCNKEEMEHFLMFGNLDNIQEFRELSSRQDVKDNLQPTESIEDVYRYIRENINPVFRGSYYDYIDTHGEKAYEELKKEITENFNKKFKHYKVKLGPDKDHYLKAVVVKNRTEDSNDIERWKRIIFESSQNTRVVSPQDLNALVDELMRQAMGMSTHMEAVTRLIAQALKGRNISFSIGWWGFTPGQAAKCVAKGGGVYEIHINENAMFVNTSGFSNMVTQTILHELIHVATESALQNDKKLQKEAEALLKEVRTALGKEAKDYGLKDIYEFFAELSNQEFVEKLKSISYKTGERTVTLRGLFSDGDCTVKVWQSLFDKVKEFVNRVARLIALRLMKETEKYPDTAYEEAVRLFVESVFSMDSYYSDKDGTTHTYGAIQAVGEPNKALKEQLSDQFDILINAYKRDARKNESSKRKQDKIFEARNKIRLMSESETILEVLMLADEELGGITTNEANTLLTYLKEQRLKERPYDDITANDLVQMYKNTIKFYGNIVNNILKDVEIKYGVQQTNFDESKLEEGKGLNLMSYELLQKLRSSVKQAESMWKEALVVVTDKLVDQWVAEDLIVDDKLGDNPAEVIKDYLHRNWFYGDIDSVTAWLFSLAHQNSPLIKLAYGQIQKVDTKVSAESNTMRTKLANAYAKVDKTTRLNPYWQRMFMEFDEDGIPTGRFVAPINYGQYERDLNDFVEQLNAKYDEQYGYHFTIDSVTGDYLKTDDMSNASDVEWAPKQAYADDKPPVFVQYLLEIEEFKCKRANRRYNFKYYKERLSRPYDIQDNPESIDGMLYLNTHHGLSPKTLLKYNNIQANINYYLQGCRDKETGEAYPERLTDPWAQSQLDLWQNELDQLSNAYYPDGTMKTGDELMMAYELKAWQRWVNDQSNQSIDYDRFEKELAVYDKAIEDAAPGTEEYNEAKNAKDIFLKYNATWQINPKLLEKVFPGVKPFLEGNNVDLARMQRGMLKCVVNGDGLVPQLERVRDNIQFFISCKHSDEIIEEDGLHSKIDGELFDEYLSMEPVLYTTKDGEWLDKDFNKTKEFHEAITYQQFLIEYYTNHALNYGEVPGLMENDQPKNFNNWTEDQIRNYFKDLFTYEHTYEEYGHEVRERRPLSIFSYMNTKKGYYINKSTQKAEFPTMIHVPKGRFAKSNKSKFDNPEYDEKDYHVEQPMKEYYDNSKAYDKVVNTPGAMSLYEQIIEVMMQGQKDMGYDNTHFDYKLPKVSASSSLYGLYQGAGYGIKEKGFRRGLGGAIAEQYFYYDPNDVDTRIDIEKSPDQTTNQTVQNKYVGTLENKSLYSHDVIQSVIKYATASIEYKYKNEILPALQAMQYAQQMENRETNAREAKRAYDVYEYMMESQMYKTAENSNKKIRKLQEMTLTAGAWKLLSAGAQAAFVGFWDSSLSIVKDGLMGRYFTLTDLLKSQLYQIFKTPQYLANIYGNRPNNKLTALRHRLMTKENAPKSYGKNRFWKFISSLGFGIYSLFDFISTQTMLYAMTNTYRFYKGDDKIPTGFYRKYDLERLFVKHWSDEDVTEKKARKAARRAFRRCHTSLYHAYYYDSKAHETKIREEYEPYVTLKVENQLRNMLINRIAINNGLTPSDGKAKYTTSFWGKLVGSMRGWLVGTAQEQTSGRDDTSVRSVETEVETNYKRGKEYRKVKCRLANKTTEQQKTRKSWNFGTGLPQEETWKALGRSLGVLLQALLYTVTLGRTKVRKLSEVEWFAVKHLVVSIAVLMSSIYGYIPIDNWCKDVVPVNLAKETPYSPKQYIQSKLYKENIRNAYIRTVNSQFEKEAWPYAAYQVVKNATVMVSAAEDMISNPVNTILFGSRADMYTDEVDNDKIVRQGKYRGYTKKESTFLKAFGPLNNIYTFDTYNGISSNTAYYAREFSWWLQAIGREYSPQKMPKTIKVKADDDIMNAGDFDINDAIDTEDFDINDVSDPSFDF